MQWILHHSDFGRLVTIVATCSLIAACSTYQPLGSGSGVPWAKAGQYRNAAPAPQGAERQRAQSKIVEVMPGGYRVQRGDRLTTLAKRHGVSVHALAQANQLEAPYVIYAGQILRIPDHAAVEREPTVVTIGDRYVVRRGETLSGIAKRIDVSMVDLAAVNQIDSPYQVYAGQKLRLPDPDVATIEPAAAKPALGPISRGAPPPLSGHGFLWPVNGKVIGGFGPIGQGQRRDGIDIAAREGAPVLAAEDGIVAYAGDGIRTLGRLILIRHDEGYITTYAHNAALLVDAGTAVERGQVIARVGSTGDVARPLLHFELRRGRQPLDPETVLVHAPTAVASTQ